MTDNRTTERVDHPPRVREAIDELMREKDANDNRTTELLQGAEGGGRMSEIKTLEDMRNTVKTIAADCDEGWILGCLDAIESEIAERFMELPEGWTGEQASDVLAYWPTWDDGSPCMFGDEFTCYPKYDGEKKYETLDRLSIFGPNHVWSRGCDDEKPHDGGYYEWNYMRPGGDGCEEYRPTKRKPCTLEDVLREFTEKYQYCISDDGRSITLAKYADEIRELLGVGE